MRHYEPGVPLVAGVEVAIPPREAAVGELQAHPVAGEKHVARGPQVDLDALTGVRAPFDAHDAVAEVEGAPAGVDVTETSDPVRRRRRTLGIQDDTDSPR